MNVVTVPTGTVLVGGLRIRCAGSGPTAHSSAWPALAGKPVGLWLALKRTARLISIDLPGLGHSEGRADVFTPVP